MATMTLDDLSAQLSRAFGDQLVAVVLYGSAARGEHVAERSDLNVLVLVRTLTPAALRAAAVTARAWHAVGNPPPLVLTEAEWRSSRDIFAIEYADILERHRVLTGALPDGPRTVAPEDLRHQLEFEAMGKLLRLRRGILASNGEAEEELALLGAARSAVLVLFRTLLRVHGEGAPAASDDVIRRAAALAKFDATVFLDLETHARGTARIPPERADEALAAYHAALETFVAHVDGLATP
jgi:predicted nucleotidyltransferase